MDSALADDTEPMTTLDTRSAAGKLSTMQIFEISFAKIIKLEEDLAEVIVNEGVDFDMDMVHEYHTWIQENMKHPCYMMINRINTYAYGFEVMQTLGTIEEIKAIAMVVYTRASEVAVAALREFPKERPWHSRIFNSRDGALQWLNNERGK